MNFRGVIFDLDGTLLDTLDDLADSMNVALQRFGAPPHPAVRYRNFVGRGLEMLTRAALPEDRRDEATVKKCLKAMREIYAVRWAIRTRPYDGIANLLTDLARLGIRRAVLSNKAHDATVTIVTHFFGNAFDMVLGNGVFPLKPDPAAALHIVASLELSPHEFIYVGDSDIDMKTATNAGMFPVGATWGFRTPEELQANGAKLLVERPGKILAALAG